MKKTLVALAALAATSAFAQSTVEIYGRAQADISQYSATGATVAANDLQARTRVADPGSRIGFRINEDLGGGLRAFSVIETGLNLDTGNNNGQGVGMSAAFAADATNGNVNTLGSREAHIGIGNSAYELRLGRQNVFWTHGELNQTAANFISTDVLGQFYAPGAGMSAGNASRLNNTIMVVFNKDSFLGAEFAGSHVYYSVNGGETTTSAAAHPNKAATQGFKLNWNMGPWAGMVDYSATRNNANNATAATDYDSSSVKYALGYKYATDSIFSYTLWDHKRDYNLAASQTAVPTIVNNVAGGVATIGGRAQSGNGINLVHALGNNWFAYGQYAVMNRASNAAGAEVDQTGAKGQLIGVRKNLSKRTAVYALYATIKNEQANAVNFAGGSYASGNAAVGADPKVTAVGIQHLF